MLVLYRKCAASFTGSACKHIKKKREEKNVKIILLINLAKCEKSCKYVMEMISSYIHKKCENIQ
jgi:hypothetical protein